MTQQSNLLTQVLWMSAYFFANLTLTIYNKAVMQFVGFSYGWSITAIHTLCCGAGCWLLCLFGVFRPARLGMKENLVMVAFSVLYTLNIAVSNISLNLVTVPFHQVVRATTPVFTILLNIIVLKTSYQQMTYISLIPVIFGVVLATLGEYNYSQIGLWLTILGTVLAAMKTVVTNVVQVGSLKLHPLDLLLRMSPLAFVQCLIFGYFDGEWTGVKAWSQSERFTQANLMALMFNGILAFFLNIASFTANKKTSALTMTVAANVKQVLSIVLAVFIFDLTVTNLNALGILITLCGGFWYARVEMQNKQAQKQELLLPKTQKTIEVK